ncbi:RNA exonuclease NGL2 [Scheffersomyces coipomensis]|uniref:RNA exonuclease NGL2 n=1 Tax=Scheffersomyces coipomensis TaxID=1788519 RepID=UPI00315C5506
MATENDSLSDNGQPIKSKKKSKKARDPSSITPEYIEEQRRLRNLKKSQKQAESKPVEQIETFIKRPLLPLPDVIDNGDGLKIKIMTYNILAQALIRRTLFPTSGDALKWATRSKTLLDEFKYYDADILCLQEVDYIQFNSFWSKEFAQLGYTSKYYRSNNKNHGLAIVFKSSMFECKNQSFINYDTETTKALVQPSTSTQNVGFIVHLSFTDSMTLKFPHLLNKNGIVIGSTHLFWAPFGTFERTRQTYVLLYKFQEFITTLNTVLANDKAKPTTYTGRVRTVLEASLAHYRGSRGVEEETEESGVESIDGEVPNPESSNVSEEEIRLIQELQVAHNSIDMRAISLYSVGYKSVDPKNAGADNDRNEPIFSNWAHTWRGLLDYILVLSKWNRDELKYSTKIDTLEELEKEQDIKLLSLLKLPMPEDMGPEPSGQPRLNQFPSDHLCLMAEVALL